MNTVLNVNGSEVCYHSSPSMWTCEYYRYCLELLVEALRNSPKQINLIFGDIHHDFNNSNRTLKIDIQSEHTLVKLGGRSVDEIVWGQTDLLDGTGKYLIRIPNYGYYSKLDATIEYSLPNMANLGTNPIYADYLKRAVHVAPTIYETANFAIGNRSQTITLGNHSDRRAALARIMGPSVLNIQNVLSKEDLRRYTYPNVKIMVNVHQTDHHHTFEELRVLPALCNGVIVVSEDVPLKHTIPYSDSIIWSSYDNLPMVVKDVQENYSRYHQQTFTHKLETEIRLFRAKNAENIACLIDRLTHN